jgi:hypothetical protein
MLRNPRVWLYAAGGWLIVTGLAHLGGHVWGFVLENGMVGQREFAMRAMKQAFSTDPLQPSLWRLMRALNAAFGLFLIFAGTVDVLLGWLDAPPRIKTAFTLFGTLFWTCTFTLFAFVDPVIQPLVIAMVAVPLHGIAWVTASEVANG